MRGLPALLLMISAGGLAACSEGFDLPKLPDLPALPSLPSLPSTPSHTSIFPGSPTTVYTRVARGSNTCWFGPAGVLDKTFIWFAKAEPESKGGGAEIAIHERVDLNQRGLKAFSVTIAAQSEGATVVVQNVKLAEALGQRMTADAYRWARGGVGCKEGDTAWGSPTPQPTASPKTPVPKSKSTVVKPDTAAPKAPAAKSAVELTTTAKSAAPNAEATPADDKSRR